MLALILGSQFAIPWMFPLSIILFGLGMLGEGIEILFFQRVTFFQVLSDEYGDWDWGDANIPWAFTFMVIGGGLLYLGVIRALGLSPSLLAYLKQHPASLLIGLALPSSGAGVALMIGPPDWNASRKTQFLHLPHRILGAVLALLSLAALALGIFDWIAPQTFDVWIRSVLGLFAPTWL